MRRCAVLEIGRNSVSPWTIPRTMASPYDIAGAYCRDRVTRPRQQTRELLDGEGSLHRRRVRLAVVRVLALLELDRDGLGAREADAGQRLLHRALEGEVVGVRLVRDLELVGPGLEALHGLATHLEGDREAGS